MIFMELESLDKGNFMLERFQADGNQENSLLELQLKLYITKITLCLKIFKKIIYPENE